VDLERKSRVILDKAQVEFMGSNPGNDEIAAWATACMNSAAGPMYAKFGGGDLGHRAVWGWLDIWQATIEEKMKMKGQT